MILQTKGSGDRRGLARQATLMQILQSVKERTKEKDDLNRKEKGKEKKKKAQIELGKEIQPNRLVSTANILP